MDKTVFLKFNTADCQFEVFGDDLVLLNFKSGNYVGVAGSGKTIFDALLQGAGIETVLANVKANQPEYLEDTSRLIELLQSCEMLVETDAPLISPELNITLLDRPIVQLFDDMADLIKSDPVHEADESTGWPIIKQVN